MKLQSRMINKKAPKEEALSYDSQVAIPSRMIPSFRTSVALQDGVAENLLLRTWGGIGDQICAEPTLRYALKAFPHCRVSLASELIELFDHLKFDRAFDLKSESPSYEKFFLFDTIVPPGHLTWEFFSHCITNCVDFASLCAFRCQLPVAEREIQLKPAAPSELIQSILKLERAAFVHPGKHWQSKTFPKAWWNSVLAELVLLGITPIIIGGDADDNRGTVDVDATWCVDLRNTLSLQESIWLLQRAKVLITNDSSPLHMAASRNFDDEATGNTWIGYIATCKHPDYITHWRRGAWNYREVNLGLGGIWEHQINLPNREKEVSVEFVEPSLLASWLPEPESVAAWAHERIN